MNEKKREKCERERERQGNKERNTMNDPIKQTNKYTKFVVPLR